MFKFYEKNQKRDEHSQRAETISFFPNKKNK